MSGVSHVLWVLRVVPGTAPAQQASAEQIVESMTAAFTAHMQQQQAAAAAQVPPSCSVPC